MSSTVWSQHPRENQGPVLALRATNRKPSMCPPGDIETGGVSSVQGLSGDLTSTPNTPSILHFLTQTTGFVPDLSFWERRD